MVKELLIGLLIYCIFAIVIYNILAYQDKKLATVLKLELKKLSLYPRLIISMMWLPFLICVGLAARKLKKDIAIWKKEHPCCDQSWFEQYLINRIMGIIHK